MYNKTMTNLWINEAKQHCGFTTWTPVQEAVIPVFLRRTSVVVRSQTGSGKTHAFLLPMFEQFTEEPTLQAVIISPTKELAEQIYAQAMHLATLKPITIRFAAGGRSTTEKTTTPQLLIGTPGKLEDILIKQHRYNLKTVKVLIIDEADMALEEGFLKTVDQIAGHLPESLQMGVFSATIPKGLEPFLKKYLSNPTFIQLADADLDLTHYQYKVKPGKRFEGLKELVSAIQPFVGIIFCNTKDDVVDVYEKLQGHVESIAMVHGGLPARSRKQMMRRIKNHEFQFVVASDIAARGIDIPDVSHVINYQLPKDLSFYPHRAGRTGRIGKSGIVITLIDVDDDAQLKLLNVPMQKLIFANQKLEW
jgi:ATP-dependent RNA helicase CshB